MLFDFLFARQLDVRNATITQAITLTCIGTEFSTTMDADIVAITLKRHLP
jgi:hypothetical protein